MTQWHLSPFRVGQLVKPRNYKEDFNMEVIMWPHAHSVSKGALTRSNPCGKMLRDEVAIVVEEAIDSVRVCASGGSVGWVDSWDIELA